jgi:hypothetical protein
MDEPNPEKYQLLRCGRCTIKYYMPMELYEKRKRDLGTFYCPVGHGRVFVKEKETEVDSVSYWRTEALHFEGKAKKLEEQLENEGD